MSDNFWIDAFKWHNEAAAESGRVASRILVLINGGAAVAVMGLIGALAGAECFESQQMQRFGNNLIWFAWGVVLAAATLCLVYLVNYCHAGAARTQIAKPGSSFGHWLWPAHVFSLSAILVGVLSLASFVLGIFAVRNALNLLNCYNKYLVAGRLHHEARCAYWIMLTRSGAAQPDALQRVFKRFFLRSSVG